MPTIPPPDEDARWVYSSGQPLGLGLATPPQGSTPPSPLRKTLSRLSLGSSRPPSAEVEVSAFVAATPSRDRRKAGEDSDKDAGKDARKGGGRVCTKGPLGPATPGDAAATTDQRQKRPFQKLWREQIRKHRYNAAARLPCGNRSAKSLPATGTGTTEERSGFRLTSRLPRSPVSSASLRAKGRGGFDSCGSPRSVDWDSPAALSLWGGGRLAVTPWPLEGASPVGSEANRSRGLAGVEMGAADCAEQALAMDL